MERDLKVKTELIKRIDSIRRELDHQTRLFDILCEQTLIDACTYRTLALNCQLSYILSELECLERLPEKRRKGG